MKINKINRQIVSGLFSSLFAAAWFASVPTGALAGQNQNQDVDGGFNQQVSQSQAVMVRVPFNAQGAEDTDAAQMRLILKSKQTAMLAVDYDELWANGIDVSDQPMVNPDVNRDSATSWWGWSPWRGYGWRYNYYNNYAPYYYWSYGYPNYYHYYNYTYPYYYSYRTGGYPYLGYNYYYYPAGNW